jgi:molybdate transport system substrate-binding protein
MPVFPYIRFVAVAMLMFISSLVATRAGAETIRVAVAISLREAGTEIAKAYETSSGEKVSLVFGSSGQLAGQIKNGAEVDVFVSAASQQVDELVKDGLADATTRRDIASNTLVLIVPADAKNAPATFADLGSARGKVATGEPVTVPAGRYAEQVFTSLKLTDRLRGRLVYGTNVRQVLAYVERGEVAAGVVYATDAAQSGEKVRVAATADPATHEPVVYPGVIVTATKRRAAAERFLAHLQSPDAKKVLRDKGFLVPDEKDGDAKGGGKTL